MFTVIKKLLFSILLIFLLIGCATNKLADTEIKESKEESQTLMLEFTYGWEYKSDSSILIYFKPEIEIESASIALTATDKEPAYCKVGEPGKEYFWIITQLKQNDVINFMFVFELDGVEYYVKEVFTIIFKPKVIV